jgi:hypothetical protein
MAARFFSGLAIGETPKSAKLMMPLPAAEQEELAATTDASHRAPTSGLPTTRPLATWVRADRLVNIASVN